MAVAKAHWKRHEIRPRTTWKRFQEMLTTMLATNLKSPSDENVRDVQLFAVGEKHVETIHLQLCCGIKAGTVKYIPVAGFRLSNAKFLINKVLLQYNCKLVHHTKPNTKTAKRLLETDAQYYLSNNVIHFESESFFHSVGHCTAC